MNMSDPHGNRPFPKGVLVAAGALILFTIGIVAVARTTGYGVVEVPDTKPVQAVQVRFDERPDGSIAVYRGRSDTLIAEFEMGSQGFIWGVVRGMDRQRMLEGAQPDAPYTLTHWADGRLSLHDPSTDRVVYLNAFGPTNLDSFARLLDAPSGPEQAMNGGTP
jgi:putative photosynthetic complex assembly protein